MSTGTLVLGGERAAGEEGRGGRGRLDDAAQTVRFRRGNVGSSWGLGMKTAGISGRGLLFLLFPVPAAGERAGRGESERKESGRADGVAEQGGGDEQRVKMLLNCSLYQSLTAS